ncbi:MAG: CHASE2 domain-containing protein [Treponema sp.]|uniref:CHASE2 domain-containing protein n=1 Tax=Treponema sp. TaxID=166 RepID=UPI0025D4CC72|nr:CHASE2 domain-containing protein [Treponema sp.]MBQ8681020.1 CHASE2 domain-containing protein [Treponema sp.]
MRNEAKKNKKSKKSFSRKLVGFIIVLSAVLGWSLICAIGALQKFDYRIYDLLLGFTKSPDVRHEILLVEADNASTSNDSFQEMRTWPWPRNIFANALIRMKEFGAATAVFDIEYLSPSSLAVNEDAIIEAASSFDGSRPEFEKFVRDNDDYFARAIQFFGNTWLTINTLDIDMKYTDEEIDYVKKRFLYDVEDKDDLILKYFRKSRIDSSKTSFLDNFTTEKPDWDDPKFQKKYLIGFSPAMHQFISHANGAGFTNVIIDMDGTRRRIELLNKKDEVFAGQLAFAPILRILNPDDIVRKKRALLLNNCKSVGGKNISIPLDTDGKMIINWLHEPFVDSFRHESMYFLAQLDELEKNVVLELKSLNGFLTSLDAVDIPSLTLTPLESAASVKKLVSDYTDIENFKEFLLSKCEGYTVDGQAIGGGVEYSDYVQYFQARKDFFEGVTAFCKGKVLDEIADRLVTIRDYIDSETFDTIQTELSELFDTLSSENDLYNSIFTEKKAIYANSFCILGHTASSTTDLGTIPFERAYMNVGTHANVYNTIMNEDFIYPVSWWWGVIIVTVLSIILIVLPAEKKAFMQNTTGVSLVFMAIVLPVILMILFKVYIPAVTTFLIAFTSYLAMTIYRFATSEKDKKFLQTTFGAYVAPAVVDQIVKNPELASLGGKSDNLTALFSDVKTFSGFTEVINNEEGEDKGAERLVAILNDYLGVLSDAIMDNKGTIDKYVGDEIVSFFGAPVHDDNNAYNACLAGIRMLQAEHQFNEENKHRLPINPQTGEPFYLHSRVGLNTGNMVVGNMGTEKKLNYTIMGNNVNLASRLEGTNKVYGSWIMCSESTWNAANRGENEGKIVARKFDCVRVINVKKPVGIYSIIGLRSELSEKRIKATDLFNEGMKWYLNGIDTPEVPKNPEDLKKAYELYKQAYELYPMDESSKVFMERCEDFVKNGLPKIWDGVYTMKSK